MKTHLFRLLKDPLQRVDEVVVVFITLKDIEAREYELVLLLDELVQQVDVVRIVVEMVAGEGVDELKELILPPRDGGLRALDVCGQLLRKSDESEAQLSVTDRFC